MSQFSMFDPVSMRAAGPPRPRFFQQDDSFTDDDIRQMFNRTTTAPAQAQPAQRPAQRRARPRQQSQQQQQFSDAEVSRIFNRAAPSVTRQVGQGQGLTGPFADDATEQLVGAAAAPAPAQPGLSTGLSDAVIDALTTTPGGPSLRGARLGDISQDFRDLGHLTSEQEAQRVLDSIPTNASLQSAGLMDDQGAVIPQAGAAGAADVAGAGGGGEADITERFRQLQELMGQGRSDPWAWHQGRRAYTPGATNAQMMEALLSQDRETGLAAGREADAANQAAAIAVQQSRENREAAQAEYTTSEEGQRAAHRARLAAQPGATAASIRRGMSQFTPRPPLQLGPRLGTAAPSPEVPAVQGGETQTTGVPPAQEPTPEETETAANEERLRQITSLMDTALSEGADRAGTIGDFMFRLQNEAGDAGIENLDELLAGSASDVQQYLRDEYGRDALRTATTSARDPARMHFQPTLLGMVPRLFEAAGAGVGAASMGRRTESAQGLEILNELLNAQQGQRITQRGAAGLPQLPPGLRPPQ